MIVNKEKINLDSPAFWIPQLALLFVIEFVVKYSFFQILTKYFCRIIFLNLSTINSIPERNGISHFLTHSIINSSSLVELPSHPITSTPYRSTPPLLPPPSANHIEGIVCSPCSPKTHCTFKVSIRKKKGLESKKTPFEYYLN